MIACLMEWLKTELAVRYVTRVGIHQIHKYLEVH
jgi:hypothetical protein